MKCYICPRMCGADRENGQIGVCGADNNIKIARAAPHMWEEPCISGTKGSGTVFFSHCNLKCVFCQNYSVSTMGGGKIVTQNELADIFLQLEDRGVHNINLVTPTHYITQIIGAIDIAKSRGLSLPIVYNTSSYENVNSLKMLDGYIDIYLPDLKYFSDKYAVKYSHAPKYFEIASKAVAEMYRQTGLPEFDDNGHMKKGTLVRHLMMPHLLFDSKKIIDYLYKTYGDNVYISIMSQYTPLENVKDYPELNNRISAEYYNCLVDYAAGLGIVNAFVQDGDSASESFIPPFNEQENNI